MGQRATGRVQVASRLYPTARDVAIVSMVHELRGCTSAQIQARFWGAEQPPAAAYRRIGRLIEAGYLSSRRLPALNGVGSGKRFLTTGAVGRRLVAEALRVPPSELARPEASTPLFLRHHEAVGDFRIALEIALGCSGGLSLRSWTAEHELRQRPVRIRDAFRDRGAERVRTITLVPDAEFVLAAGGRLQMYRLEMDMGTISVNRLSLRVRGYLRLQEAGPVPVLFVAPTQERTAYVNHLVEVQAAEVGGYTDAFFITTSDAITQETILTGPIWRRAGIRELQPLIGRVGSAEAGKGIDARALAS